VDTADLLAAVEQRVAEIRRDRERLAETVAALDDELGQYQSEAEVLTRLISRFVEPVEEHEHTDDQPDQREAVRAEADTSALLWPSGPGFDQLLKTKKPKAWAKYKMEAADWYLDTLLAMSLQGGRMTRVLGTEMAVEGVIQSLCAGFEVMIGALTKSIEKAVGVPSDRRTPLHLASWSRLAAFVKVFNVDLACSLSVSAALLGERSEQPEGPLAQLFVLRSRSAVQDLLVEVSDGDDVDLAIDVPGRGALPLLDYLFEARNLVGELLETIVHDVADAKAGRLYVPDSNELRERAEHGLGEILAPNGLLAS
jgi:hypothetical protein